jgi:hypothetical protein
MGRNYLAGTHGDAANAILAAAGYNFRRLLEWLALLLSIILAALTAAASQQRALKSARRRSSRATNYRGQRGCGAVGDPAGLVIFPHCRQRRQGDQVADESPEFQYL